MKQFKFFSGLVEHNILYNTLGGLLTLNNVTITTINNNVNEHNYYYQFDNDDPVFILRSSHNLTLTINDNSSLTFTNNNKQFRIFSQ